MKKSKIFLATGTLVLAVTAIFATKATKKFAAVTEAETNSTGLIFIVKPNSSGFVMNTVKVAGQLQLHGGGIAAADEGLITVTHSNPVYH